MNPGPWGDHCRTAASTARAIAAAARGMELDPDVAYVLGLLHDIGRRSGSGGMRHAPDGYEYLAGLGYDDAARICLTHSFPAPLRDVRYAFGEWECSEDHVRRVQVFLSDIEYTAYDRLIQLCDVLALPEGPVLMEKRFLDVVLRHGLIRGDLALTVEKWQAFLAVKDELDEAVGGSIYRVLPGVVDTTFGARVSAASG